MSTARPLVSVVIEGYNEYLSFEDIDTWAGLEAQRYPLERVEVILVGSAVQAARWSERFADPSPFRIGTGSRRSSRGSRTARTSWPASACSGPQRSGRAIR